MTENNFNEYRLIVTGLLGETPKGDALNEDLSTLFAIAKLMLKDNAEIHQSLIDGLKSLADKQEIASLPKRPCYPLLALHVHLAAFENCYLNLPDRIWENATDTFEKLAAPLRVIESYRDAPPPHMSTEVVLWQAYCLLEIGTIRHFDSDIELAHAVIDQIVDRPVDDNPLTEQDPEESRDGWTYRELIGMHALANAALYDHNEKWASRVELIGVHHLYNTQPDHCTSEPWGLFGFLWSEESRMFGVQQIHDCKAYGLVGVGQVLLADALRCINAFD